MAHRHADLIWTPHPNGPFGLPLPVQLCHPPFSPLLPLLAPVALAGHRMTKLLHTTLVLSLQPLPLFRFASTHLPLRFPIEVLDRVEGTELRAGIGGTLLLVQFPLDSLLAGEKSVHHIHALTGFLVWFRGPAWCDGCSEVSLPNSEDLTCLVPLSVGVAGSVVLIYPPQDRVRHEVGQPGEDEVSTCEVHCMRVDKVSKLKKVRR